MRDIIVLQRSDGVLTYLLSHRDIVGKVDTPTPIPKMSVKTPDTKESNGEVSSPSPTPKLRLRSILNMSDFEVAASQRLSPKAFACEFFFS